MSPLWHCHAPCQRSSAYSRNGESDNGNYEVEPARIRVAFFSSTFLPPLRMLSGGETLWVHLLWHELLLSSINNCACLQHLFVGPLAEDAFLPFAKLNT